MMTNDPPEVLDNESAVAFVLWCVETIGLGYHPDTRFEDYTDQDGKQSFDAATADKLNELQNAAFTWCDPYEIGAAEFEKLLALDGSDSSAV